MGRTQRYLQKSDRDTGGCQTEIQTEVRERNNRKRQAARLRETDRDRDNRKRQTDGRRQTDGETYEDISLRQDLQLHEDFLVSAGGGGLGTAAGTTPPGHLVLLTSGPCRLLLKAVEISTIYPLERSTHQGHY